MRFQAIALVSVNLAFLAGCASTMSQEDLEARTAQAVGRSVGQFTITDRTEETGGRVNYTVNVKGGGAYRCYLYGATGFQRAMSFGQTPHSDAVCNAVANGKAPAASGDRSRSGGGPCNALTKAAGRC